MPPGVYSLDDLREHGAETVICPYFMARKLVGKYFNFFIIEQISLFIIIYI